MAINIKTLLSKKGWTGVEVGKALVASIIHDIRHQNEPDYKPLFSQKDFDIMERSLSAERDFLAYGVYKYIYQGIIDGFNKGQGQYQQFYNGYYRYAMQLKDAYAAEDMLGRVEYIPYVMTEKQYKDLKKRTEAMLRNYKESFNSLIFSLLCAFKLNPEEAPEVINEAIEATKKEAVTNARILSDYNSFWGIGYYQLADGTRSDQVTIEEWQEKLKEDFLKNHKLYNADGEPASWEEAAEYYETKIQLKGYELFFKGIDAVKTLYKERTGEELPQETRIMKDLEFRLRFGDSSQYFLDRGEKSESSTVKKLLNDTPTTAEWHDYTEPPSDITKYDVLKEIEEYEFSMAEFKADYPALYDALEAYIKENIPQAKELNPTQYDEDFISWGELAKLKIGEYVVNFTIDDFRIIELLAKEDEGTTEDLIKRARIHNNGIAIQQKGRCREKEYTDDVQKIIANAMVRSIDDLANNESQKEEVLSLPEILFKPALQYLYAFNTLVKMLGVVYGLEEMQELEISTAYLESQIDGLNYMLYMFYTKVHGTPEEKERKRALIKELFSPINYEELKPTQEAIKAVSDELDEMDFNKETQKKLGNLNYFIDKLCERGL